MMERKLLGAFCVLSVVSRAHRRQLGVATQEKSRTQRFRKAFTESVTMVVVWSS